jgi:hypothetical protein
LEESKQDGSNHEAEKAKIPLSNADQESIYHLAQELGAPRDVVAEIYRRELARLRLTARVTAFLPLVVSRLVRRSLLTAAG